MQKVTVNVGLGRGLKDKAHIDTIVSTVERITGQKPVFTKAASPSRRSRSARACRWGSW